MAPDTVLYCCKNHHRIASLTVHIKLIKLKNNVCSVFIATNVIVKLLLTFAVVTKLYLAGSWYHLE